MVKKATQAEVFSAMMKTYPATQYTFVQFLTEHLVDCAREFDGDLGQVLVLAILGQRALAERLSTAREGAASRVSMTASRIADVSGLPRETVRRKLLQLEKRGWIVREDTGAWTLVTVDSVSQVRRDLSALDSRSLDRLARLYCQLSNLM